MNFPSSLDQLLLPGILLRVVKHLANEPPQTEDETLHPGFDFGMPFPDLVEAAQSSIRAGFDPLGSAYCRLNSPMARRAQGQTFTPLKLVRGMFDWVGRQSTMVTRIVDPGAGSGRYVLYGLRKFHSATAIAVERDPCLALLLRANACALGLDDRLDIVVADYREVSLPAVAGRTVFIGNPPYVRHHDIEPAWKQWYADSLRRLGHSGSQLAGLHLHFFLKTLELSRAGDLGCFVTASEWLDVKYGQALRDLLTDGLGGKSVFVVSPSIPVFEDAMVSASITCFAPHSRQTEIEFREINAEGDLDALVGGHQIRQQVARDEPKWTILVRNRNRSRPDGHIELGEIFKVQRGQVTGLNRVWVHQPGSPELPLKHLYPCITDARDIVRAPNAMIDSTEYLKSVVDLPVELDDMDSLERHKVNTFIAWARSLGADKSYIAEHRSPWWRVKLKDPAPIVVTYMGRRPPVFARNLAGARLINVAHGLYPREGAQIDEPYMRTLVAWLNQNVRQDDGRVYAGGLTKFEPSEVMRLYIPDRSEICAMRHATA